MQSQKKEISDICLVLEKLANSGVFSEDTAASCSQAASLLMHFREVVISGAGTSVRSPDHQAIVTELMNILIEQGEG